MVFTGSVYRQGSVPTTHRVINDHSINMPTQRGILPISSPKVHDRFLTHYYWYA